MIDEKLYTQFSSCIIEDLKGITIHNTNNKFSAKENLELMLQLTIPVSCNYFVDEEEVIEVLPVTRGAWHTGKGLDDGNTKTIAIEICRSTCDFDTYYKAQRRAVELIKSLMEENNLTIDNIYFHNDFDRMKYCPHRILDIWKTKKNFIEREVLKDGDTINE